MKTLLSLMFFLSINTYALTWDEPWQKDVVKGADSFGLYTILKNTGNTLKIKQVKHLAGEEYKSEITVSSFYHFNVASSSSGHEDPLFFFKKGQKVYFYIKKSQNKFQVASPTAGQDEILPSGNVAASFRISIHKTKIDPETYESSQTCIFLTLHNGNCSSDTLHKIIDVPLKERVAVLSPDASKEDFKLFFRQHVALETSYLTNYTNTYETLKPFLTSKFFHVQISAVRALAGTTLDTKGDQLIEYVTKSEATDIAKVMAIVMLKELNVRDNSGALSSYLPSASKEEVSLVSSIMDPRVATWYPESVQEAINWYLEQHK